MGNLCSSKLAIDDLSHSSLVSNPRNNYAISLRRICAVEKGQPSAEDVDDRAAVGRRATISWVYFIPIRN